MRNADPAGKKILIIAGEASGDLHGANLVREVRKQDPSIHFFGVGSRRMKVRNSHANMLIDPARMIQSQRVGR